MVKEISFERSNILREEARKIVPLGAQTFTRSYTQFPYNYSPLFATKGRGGHIWDVDNNEYVDLLSGLLSVVLGYCDPDTDQAIKDQLDNGITFSLTSELELELARLLTQIIPSAEMVRYGKNGSDVTAAAIRLSRHITKRDRVAVCGYHGWQDWYACTTSLSGGIPDAVSNLTHTFEYNNIDSLIALLKKHPGEFAAVIMEPMNVESPKDNFLHKVKEVAHQHGALFIFDEIITGFRFALGGAQQLFDVTPDLSTFGKAMANGMPLSVLVGKAEYMSRLQEVFYSGTFAAETLSLAAAVATIKKMQREDVVGHIWRFSEELKQRATNLLQKYNLQDAIKFKGLTPWTIVAFQDYKDASRNLLRTFFQKEMISNGVFMLTSHNINFAHNAQDMQIIETAYDKTLNKMAELLEFNRLQDALGTTVLEPVFTARKYNG